MVYGLAIEIRKIRRTCGCASKRCPEHGGTLGRPPKRSSAIGSQHLGTVENSKTQNTKIDKLTKIVFEAEVGSQKLNKIFQNKVLRAPFRTEQDFAQIWTSKERNTTKLWPEPILIVAFSFLISSCPTRKSTN